MSRTHHRRQSPTRPRSRNGRSCERNADWKPKTMKLKEATMSKKTDQLCGRLTECRRNQSYYQYRLADGVDVSAKLTEIDAEIAELCREIQAALRPGEAVVVDRKNRAMIRPLAELKPQPGETWEAWAWRIKTPVGSEYAAEYAA